LAAQKEAAEKARKTTEAKKVADEARKEAAVVAARIAQEEASTNAAAAKEARRKAVEEKRTEPRIPRVARASRRRPWKPSASACIGLLIVLLLGMALRSMMTFGGRPEALRILHTLLFLRNNHTLKDHNL
jgi:hypothetical protein